MFTKDINKDFGVFFVEKRESKTRTSIHMMFMNYDIAVIWLDKIMVVVDKVLAKRWKPMYAPKKPAQYILELLRQNRYDLEKVIDYAVCRNTEYRSIGVFIYGHDNIGRFHADQMLYLTAYSACYVQFGTNCFSGLTDLMGIRYPIRINGRS